MEKYKYVCAIYYHGFLGGTFEQFQNKNQTGIFDHLVKIVMYALCSMNKIT